MCIRDSFYLGRVGGAALFCAAAENIGIGQGAEPATADVSYPEPDGGWQHPFSIGDGLSPIDAEIMTVALALVNWHESMPFSGRDGGVTTVAHGGWARIDAQGGEHFPRTDPAVIVLIEHEDRLLLGSNVLWETGRFSLLAGFVEAGESAEQAVIREVQEESGAVSYTHLDVYKRQATSSQCRGRARRGWRGGRIREAPAPGGGAPARGASRAGKCDRPGPANWRSRRARFWK